MIIIVAILFVPIPSTTHAETGDIGNSIFWMYGTSWTLFYGNYQPTDTPSADYWGSLRHFNTHKMELYDHQMFWNGTPISDLGAVITESTAFIDTYLLQFPQQPEFKRDEWSVFHYHCKTDNPQVTSVIVGDMGAQPARFLPATENGTRSFDIYTYYRKTPGGYNTSVESYEVVYADGVEFYRSNIAVAGSGYPTYRFMITNAKASHVAPVITSVGPLVAVIGDTPIWDKGIAAHWGITTSKSIPDDGEIKDISLVEGTDAKLSYSKTIFDQVGHREHDYEIRDDHSLGTQYPDDNTFAETSRFITVVTEDKTNLQAYLHSTTTPFTTSYNGSYWLAGSNSTTADANRRHNVDLKAETTTPGEYDFTIKKGLNTATSAHKTNFLPNANTTSVSLSNYGDESTSVSGDSFTSILLAHNLANPGTPLSPEVPLSDVSESVTVKIDSQAPNAPTVTPADVDDWSSITPSATDNGPSGVPDVDNDGYYYKFVTANTTVTTPSGKQAEEDEGWRSVNDYDLPSAPGSYDLYVYAKDLATNRSAVTKANDTPIDIGPSGPTGEFIVKKATIQGATIHDKDCVNYESINRETTCEDSCANGSQKDLVPGMPLTYKLSIKNSNATIIGGEFEDLLPAGIDTSVEPTLSSTAVPSGSVVSNLRATLEGDRWKITGYYTLLEGVSSDITIECLAPQYEDVAEPSKVISNQAEFEWSMTDINGSSGLINTKTNYANHRINEPAKISKASDKGAALHSHDCPNPTSLEEKDDCQDDCQAGSPGTINIGDEVTYTITFENPSLRTQYFATDANKYYDKVPQGVTLANKEWSASLSDNGTYDQTATTPDTGKMQVGGTWPDANGNNLKGLSFDATGISQDGATSLSLAPGAKLTITIKAEVVEAGSSNLANQIKSGYRLDGDNNAALTTDDSGVLEVVSNYATYQRKSPVVVTGVATEFTKVGADELDVPLKGAEFALYKWEGTTSEYTGHDQDILDVTLLNGVDDSDTDIKWLRATTDGANATIDDYFTSAADGKIDLGTLPDGIYTLIETKAPEGYELPVGQWIITIDSSKDNTVGNYQIEYTAKGMILPPATVRTLGASAGDAPTYKVVNVRPFSIGMSGANGTRGITIIGLALMLLAGIGYSIYNIRRKTSGKEKFFMKR